MLLQGAQVSRDRLGVAPGDGPGQRGVTLLEGALEGGRQQRPEHCGRVAGAGRADDVERRRHQGHEVVRAVGEAGVPERPELLGHGDRAAAELADQPFGDGPVPAQGGDPVSDP